MKTNAAAVLSAIAVGVGSSVAFAQAGPVAAGCKDDIAKLCPGKAHDGEVRICLESNYAKVAAACKQALDTTGGGRGRFLYGKGK